MPLTVDTVIDEPTVDEWIGRNGSLELKENILHRERGAIHCQLCCRDRHGNLVLCDGYADNAKAAFLNAVLQIEKTIPDWRLIRGSK